MRIKEISTRLHRVRVEATNSLFSSLLIQVMYVLNNQGNRLVKATVSVSVSRPSFSGNKTSAFVSSVHGHQDSPRLPMLHMSTHTQISICFWSRCFASNSVLSAQPLRVHDSINSIPPKKVYRVSVSKKEKYQGKPTTSVVIESYRFNLPSKSPRHQAPRCDLASRHRVASPPLPSSSGPPPFVVRG